MAVYKLCNCHKNGMRSIKSGSIQLEHSSSRMGFSRVARILVLITILALLGLLSSENNSYSAVLSWTDDTSFIRDWKCRLPLLDTLNVASRIFVIGLPHRHFRRLQMERLRCILGLKFVYVDALYHTTPLITHIMNQVRELRLASGVALEGNGTVPLGILEFSWPEDIDRLSNEVGPLEKRGSDLWLDSAPSPSLKDFFTLKKHLVPLTAALKNATIQPYYHDLRSSQILTAARVACWYSHTKLIRRIAESGNRSDEVSIVLEDDVDMEIDIRERLAGVWDSLPPDWEILFLGMSETSRPFFLISLASI